MQSLLGTYLNDHLAGATAGRDLARRAASSNRGDGRYGPLLAELAREVDEDRDALLAIMRALDVGTDRLKLAGGWGAEKLGRLKPNGRLWSYSPLSRVVELEVLCLGVTGKLGLWRSLAALAAEDPRLRADQIAALIARAEAQLARLEPHRLRAVTSALGDD